MCRNRVYRAALKRSVCRLFVYVYEFANNQRNERGGGDSRGFIFFFRSFYGPSRESVGAGWRGGRFPFFVCCSRPPRPIIINRTVADVIRRVSLTSATNRNAEYYSSERRSYRQRRAPYTDPMIKRPSCRRYAAARPIIIFVRPETTARWDRTGRNRLLPGAYRNDLSATYSGERGATLKWRFDATPKRENKS